MLGFNVKKLMAASFWITGTLKLSNKQRRGQSLSFHAGWGLLKKKFGILKKSECDLGFGNSRILHQMIYPPWMFIFYQLYLKESLYKG